MLQTHQVQLSCESDLIKFIDELLDMNERSAEQSQMPTVFVQLEQDLVTLQDEIE